MKNQLYYGDNLEILRDKIPAESVDLCYIDPPFNSKRDYSLIYNTEVSGDKAQSQAFTDTWRWGESAIQDYEYLTNLSQLNQNHIPIKLISLIRGLREVLGDCAMLAYLVNMTMRILEIHRVLKPTGSFYLHCDPTASHYLKIVCDCIFNTQGGKFLNEIVWCYASGGASKNHFSKKHDVILMYVKNLNHYKFYVNNIREPYSSSEKVEYKIIKGKKYLRKHPLGRIPLDWWQIPVLTNTSKERLGYDTQKPEKLLEKIIKASSNEGDVVLDAYCGCGTTVAVAERFNRKWIGIDITFQSISLILKRLSDSYSDWDKRKENMVLSGIPRDMESAIALAHKQDDRLRKEFEKWAILTYSDNMARINEKKGADGGADGFIYFMKNARENGKVLIQVKSGKVSRNIIPTLDSDCQKFGAEIGILITLENPSKQMQDEANNKGFFYHESFPHPFKKIQIITIAEILNGSRFSMPYTRSDIVKSAEKKEFHENIELEY